MRLKLPSTVSPFRNTGKGSEILPAPLPCLGAVPFLSYRWGPRHPRAQSRRPWRQAEGRKINRQPLMAAVIMAVIMAFIWLPNESHHRLREKLSIAWALMNFFANCNQARPSQLAD